MTGLRRLVASVVWLAAVVAALSLSIGALLVALDASRDNDAVALVLTVARAVDGPFWKLFHFTQHSPNGRLVPDTAEEHLANWGLAALAYLVVGRIADRLVRP